MSRVIHFEIPSDNPEKAVEFYSKAFGWKLNRWGEYEYWLATTGDEKEPGINGAITRRGTVPAVTNTIAVDNLEEAMKAIEANGGKITRGKSAVPGIGYLAMFEDPDGNLGGIMQQDTNAK